VCLPVYLSTYLALTVFCGLLTYLLFTFNYHTDVIRADQAEDHNRVLRASLDPPTRCGLWLPVLWHFAINGVESYGTYC